VPRQGDTQQRWRWLWWRRICATAGQMVVKVTIRLINAVICTGEERLFAGERMPQRSRQAAMILIELGDSAFAHYGNAHETAPRMTGLPVIFGSCKTEYSSSRHTPRRVPTPHPAVMSRRAPTASATSPPTLCPFQQGQCLCWPGAEAMETRWRFQFGPYPVTLEYSIGSLTSAVANSLDTVMVGQGGCRTRSPMFRPAGYSA